MGLTQPPIILMHKILFYGFGGHGQVTETALAADIQLVGFFDQSLPSDWAGGVPYLGKYDPSVLPDFPILITIGDNAIREKVANEVKHAFANVISSHAFCSIQVTLGEGTVVFQGAVVQSRASLGSHVIVNAGAVIDHDVQIADFVHIGPGAVVASMCQIGKGAFIGAGAVIPGKSVVPPGTILSPGTTFQPQNEKDCLL